MGLKAQVVTSTVRFFWDEYPEDISIDGFRIYKLPDLSTPLWEGVGNECFIDIEPGDYMFVIKAYEGDMESKGNTAINLFIPDPYEPPDPETVTSMTIPYGQEMDIVWEPDGGIKIITTVDGE